MYKVKDDKQNYNAATAYDNGSLRNTKHILYFSHHILYFVTSYIFTSLHDFFNLNPRQCYVFCHLPQ